MPLEETLRGAVQEYCKRDLPGQCFAGYEKHDLLHCGCKLAGAAQRRNKFGLLIQGSVQPPPVGLERKGWEAAMVSVEVGIASLVEFDVSPKLHDRVTGLANERYSSAAYNERR